MKIKAKTPTKEERYALAFYYAMKAHESQFRKGTGRPYIEHPIRVSTLLLEMQAPESLVIAGFLHDVVEDTRKGLDDIKKLFGAKVAALVKSVTENKDQDWEKRKQSAIRKLKSAKYDVVLLAFADKLDNLRSIKQDYERSGSAIWDTFARPRESQRWYYSCLADAFGKRLKGKPAYPLYLEFKGLFESVFAES